jgi:alginate O-acetyltransferase complex protein AlgJ
MSSDVKRFFLKCLLFLMPFFILVIFELFMLPIDYFTFRVWEALHVKKMYAYLPGPFYPNRSISKVESGDLAPHTGLAVLKNVRWTTDRYGFRNVDSNGNDYDIIIVGDSMIAGTGLSQENTLSNVLAKMTGKRVYSFAPSDINTFLSEERFKKKIPRIVIFASVERNIKDIPPLIESKTGWKQNIYQKIKHNYYLQEFFVFLDRLAIDNMINAIKSQVSAIFEDQKKIVSNKIVFLQGASANKEVDEEKIHSVISNLKSYQNKLVSSGSCFIFLPIPNKENIYYKLLPQSPKPYFLSNLIKKLRKEKIFVIDTQSMFEKKYEQEHQNLYFFDDTHWNSKGVKTAAHLLVEAINQCKNFHLKNEKAGFD